MCLQYLLNDPYLHPDESKPPSSHFLILNFIISLHMFLATDLEARVRFPALPEKKVVGLEQGPLSLMSTTEELLDRKVAAPV
jgi:hypothetical protein